MTFWYTQFLLFFHAVPVTHVTPYQLFGASNSLRIPVLYNTSKYDTRPDPRVYNTIGNLSRGNTGITKKSDCLVK